MRRTRQGSLRHRSPPLTRFQPGQGKDRVVATRRKTRAEVRSPCRFMGNHGAAHVARDREVSRRRLIVPNGREGDIATGRRGPKAPPFFVLRFPTTSSHTPLADGATSIRSRAHENPSPKYRVLCRHRSHADHYNLDLATGTNAAPAPRRH